MCKVRVHPLNRVDPYGDSAFVSLFQFLRDRGRDKKEEGKEIKKADKNIHREEEKRREERES